MTEEPKLPPLPEPLLETNGDVFGHENVQGFTADQIREYARQAVLMERERCAKLVEAEAMRPVTSGDPDYWLPNLAAAIRKG